ncbi:hypothetical protein ABVF61_27870 [Roseibium sp. HPY-6]|uniref:hypothetical protein n=1 Tax=Roseibium sp. HPY-6 TaxID=3229852 RepID=UPI00338F1949
MVDNSARANEVQAVIETLIHNVGNNNTGILDEIYHDDMKVIMLSPDDEVSVSDKTAFKEVVLSALKENNGSIGTWAKFHHITVEGENAHVLISRRNELTGPDMQITLGIDLIHVQGRWQITREVILTRPLPEAA